MQKRFFRESIQWLIKEKKCHLFPHFRTLVPNVPPLIYQLSKLEVFGVFCGQKPDYMYTVWGAALRPESSRPNWIAHWRCQTKLSSALKVTEELESRTGGDRTTWVAKRGHQTNPCCSMGLPDRLGLPTGVPDPLQLRDGDPDQIDTGTKGWQNNLICPLGVLDQHQLPTGGPNELDTGTGGYRRTWVTH